MERTWVDTVRPFMTTVCAATSVEARAKAIDVKVFMVIRSSMRSQGDHATAIGEQKQGAPDASRRRGRAAAKVDLLRRLAKPLEPLEGLVGGEDLVLEAFAAEVEPTALLEL